MRFLEERFARLEYKGVPVKVVKPASDKNLKGALDIIGDRLGIDVSRRPNIWDNISKKDAMSIPEFSSFYQRHAIETKYSFQVRVRSPYCCF